MIGIHKRKIEAPFDAVKALVDLKDDKGRDAIVAGRIYDALHMTPNWDVVVVSEFNEPIVLAKEVLGAPAEFEAIVTICH